MKPRRFLLVMSVSVMVLAGLVLFLTAVVRANPQTPPVVVAQWPLPNTFTVPRTTTVSVTYDQPISPTTVTYRTFAAHAMQTGWVSQTLAVLGDEIVLTPMDAFHPGELVQASATTGTLNLSGEEPISPTVWQFWAGVEGGSGAFYDSGQVLGDDASGGLGLGDLDGDGDLDAFVGDYLGPSEVYLNDGTGHFTDTGQSLVGLSTNGVALGDLDGDGDLDAFEARSDGNPNQVWWNDGTGTFTNSGQNLGNLHSRYVSLGDLDGDGDLDAFVPNSAGSGQPNKVYLNNGLGLFIDSSQNLGLEHSVGSALGDLDGDGDLDAFVANGHFGPGANKVWINDGSGVLTDSGQLLGNGQSVFVALGDLDNDSDLDAFVTNLNQPMGGEPDEVWINDGSGTFTLTQLVGSGASFGIALGDLDADGDLDALVCMVGGSIVWLNDGSGAFSESGQTLNCALPGLGDLDGDGDLDTFAARGGTSPYPNEVWFNVSESWNTAVSYSETVGFYGRAQCPDDPDSIYVVGGRFTGGYSDAFRRYDAATNSWQDLADFPAQLFGMAATCYEDHIYVAGGGQVGQFTTDDFYIYDITANSWITGPTLPRNVATANLGAWDGYLYLIGGDDAPVAPLTPETQVDRYDIQAGVWEAEWGTPMPVAAVASGVQAGPVMYLAGGWTAAGTDDNSMYALRYDMVHDTWTWVPNFASRRAVFGLAVTEQYLYAIGGDPNGDGTYWGTTSLVERLDWTAWPDSTWEAVDSLPLSVSANTAGACTEALTGGEVWSVAGVVGQGVYTDTAVFLPAEPCFRVVYGLALTPAATGGDALPGETVTYHLILSNTGTVPDTYSVTVDALWPTAAPLTVGPVDPYQALTVTVVVTVPLEANPPDSDAATVTVSSVQSPGETAVATLTTGVTTVEQPTFYIYLPVMMKPEM